MHGVSDDPIRKLLIHPEAEVRQRLAEGLSRESDISIVGSGMEIAEVLTQATSGSDPPKPDVAVIYADIPEMMHVRTLVAMRSLLPYGVNIVALTHGQNVRVLENMLAAGAGALHRPDASPAVLCRAIKTVADGKVDFDPELTELAKRLLWEHPRIDVVQVGGLSVSLDSRRASRWGNPIELSSLEYEVLRHLAAKIGEPATVEELLREVWNTSLDAGGTADQVKSCVKRLRRKVEPDPRHPRYIKSVRGAGYCLQDPLRGALSDG